MNAVMENLPAAMDTNRALLPESYKAARTALSNCSRIDECKDWTDKAQALASYARQAKDSTLRKLAERIAARASRRCGELLKQFGSDKGGWSDHKCIGADTLPSRSQAAKDAGLTRRQKVTALRVASVPEAAFESLVDSDDPPTVNQLARLGTQPSRFPIEPDLSAIQKFARFCGSTDAASLATSVVSEGKKRELKALVGEIDSWLDQFITSL